MIVDLHAHYPMHVVGRSRGSLWKQLRSREGRRLLNWRIKAALVNFAGRFGNYRTFFSGPRVRIEYMQEGGVGVALSVLFSFFAEVDVVGGVEPGNYLDELEAQRERVEEDIESSHSGAAKIVANPEQLEEAHAAGKIALVHCVEGGFHLGSTPSEVETSVNTLADRGVAYITLAHLIWREVATDAPALPWWSDSQYRHWLPQPEDEGLSDLGKAAVKAMVERHVLIDLSHMSKRSIADTFELLDALDGDSQEKTPVFFTHAGFRLGEQEYMPDRETVEEVHRRKGVIGLIMARHQIEDRIPKREKPPRLPRRSKLRFERSFGILCEHIEEIHCITGSYENISIGSDFDGFIKPTLAGLEDMRDMATLERALQKRFGAVAANAICSGNAMRLLTTYWAGA